MSNSEIRFIDTTLRDGNQSLWALNMKIGAMLPAAEQLDQAGFESLEFFVGAFKKRVRDLKENPWEWLREGAKRFRKTRLRWHGSSSGSFEKVPRCIRKLIIERFASYGITLNRTSDPWNDFSDFNELDDLKEFGMDLVLNVIFSVSPRHTDEYYEQKTKEAAAIKPWRICFKDVGGLLTTERVQTLIPIVLQNAGDIPVEFHAHCNTGQAPLCYLEGVKLGMKILHTAVPPLANGASQPSVFNIAKNLRLLGYTPMVDLEPLEAVEKHLTAVAKREGLPIGRPPEYDHSQYLHQVPGGMISNMRHQLKLVGMEQKMDAALEEAIHVRRDFGYPIMVTPLSQFVGTQAAINVITGERYKEVPDQIIQYALGYWGNDAPKVMDPDIRDKILSRSDAKKWSEFETPEPSLHEIRQKFGVTISDEELILRFFAGDAAVDSLPVGIKPCEYVDTRQPALKIIEQLAKQKKNRQVYIKRSDFSIRMKKLFDPKEDA
ncbi:MAG: hypothetical protein Q8P24_05600 [Desulfobacterales bacterium]|nr:hypothetical protein [Desulfobacterales bacterium]